MKDPTFHFLEGSGFPPLPLAEGLPAPDSMAASSERADAQVYLADSDGRVIAHAALWWRETPALDGSRVGAIGGFAASSADPAKLLLHGAEDCLREAGCRIAVGPMNGNTWRRHRYVTDGDQRGPFLLEPRNLPEYPEWWRRAGFAELSRYSSSVIRLDGRGVATPEMRERLERSGVVIRRLDPACHDDELRIIHAVSLKSFTRNFLYTPLEETSFLESYGKLRGQVDPDFVRIAERAGVPCGFVFAIRDLEAAARGESPALIVKTLAVEPESRGAGLGSLLVDDVHAAAFEKGYTESIHAMEHEANASRRITGRYGGRIFRNYALFSKSL